MMGIISSFYRKSFVCRYDKEVGIPYYSHTDFEGLNQERFSFINSKGIEIQYFYYYYDNYRKDKVILFCHGIGPGHTAYMAEINELAKRGYKILALDYCGCGESKGKILNSLNEPTRDVNDLLDYLKLDVPVVLVGHSLGGYTALNISNLRKDINKAVVLSGFLSISSLALGILKSKFIVSRILSYERKQEPEYFKLDNINYLKTTDNDIFFIQSSDDGIVSYNIALGLVMDIDNPHIKKLKIENRKHNPNYTDAAIAYMNEVFAKYNTLIKEKKIKTDEDKINYFKDVSLAKLVEQDQDLFNQIAEFIG